MQEIKDLLTRFKNILHTEESKKSSIIEIIKECTSVALEPKELEIKSNQIYINTKPINKSQIFLKKEEILNKLRDLPQKQIIQDIR